ncbi:MAG: Nramp family divalent metal transporter [Luminiphilus sp.]|nr:Nramp family divalent metal transporter [Luminiphilus sp.]
MSKTRQHFGPGAMVAAAFIGPGTVTTATLAGGNFGFTLLWAVAFSVIATLVLQEMTCRLGVIGQLGLGDAIVQKTQSRGLYIPAAALVICAIFIGNAAYEAGNITGAAVGLPKFSVMDINLWGVFIGAVAFLLLASGKFRLIEHVLVGLVVCMALVFVGTAVVVAPPFLEILKGLITPTLPENGILVIIGLIGTTVVPYNLFLHAATLKRHAADGVTLAEARRDITISVLGGGLITLCIVITAAAALHGSGTPVVSLNDMAPTLQPLLGDSSSTFLAIGFLAAGLSSAITAPLAAAYAVTEIVQLRPELKNRVFRWTWQSVIIAGVLFASLSLKPLQLILLAQIANGALLPVIALFILWVSNDKTLLREHSNNRIQNLLGCAVVGVTLVLGLRSILLATGWL